MKLIRRSSKLAVLIRLTTWLHGQVHVNRYSKIFGRLRDADCRVSNSKRVRRRYRVCNPWCRYDQCFRLVIVDVMDALLHGLNEFINLLWRGRFLRLSVICKRMMKDRVAVLNVRERCGIQVYATFHEYRGRHWMRSEIITDTSFSQFDTFVFFSVYC